MPWLQVRFQTTTDPRRSVVGGSSAGGLGAAYIAWRHPGRVGKVLSQSGWFGGPRSGRPREPGWLPAPFIASPSPSLEFYLDAGSLETGTGEGPEEILPANRRFRDILLASGNVVHYSEFEGGHDYVVWRGTLSDGLHSLLPRRARSDRPPSPPPGTTVE
jgi:enterochelin esterase-like enzyme